MLHVKPWADTITFAAVSDTLSLPRVMGSPMSGAMFHVKHGKRLSRRRQKYVARPYRGVAVLVDVVLRRR